MLIFIAGVHGVGKGYLCSFAKDDFRVTHVSASELIKIILILNLITVS